MQIYYVRFAGHFNFGVWRDEMQAQGWINELGQRFESLSQSEVLRQDYLDNLNDELKTMLADLRDVLFGYADEQTKMALKKDPLEAVSIAMFLGEEFRDDPTNIAIDSFEVHDDFYQENLEKRFRKNAQIK